MTWWRRRRLWRSIDAEHRGEVVIPRELRVRDPQPTFKVLNELSPTRGSYFARHEDEAPRPSRGGEAHDEQPRQR